MTFSFGKRSRRGNTLVEFAVVAPFWIAVFFGTIAVGTNLTRTIQVIQISRDLGHMYAKGVDFTAASSVNLLTGAGTPPSASLVQGMDLNSSTGNTVIIFSQVRHVYSTDSDCTGGTCANAGSDVFVNRIVLGKSSLKASILGNPNASDLDSRGGVVHLLTDTANKTSQAALFPATYTWPGKGSVAYVVEVYVELSGSGVPWI